MTKLLYAILTEVRVMYSLNNSKIPSILGDLFSYFPTLYVYFMNYFIFVGGVGGLAVAYKWNTSRY